MKKNGILIHILLFLATALTSMFAGGMWRTGIVDEYFTFNMLRQGIPYAAAVLFVLSVHEFGHYFAARYHKVKASLPYYIPFPPIPGFLNFGTMGAVIRTRSLVPNNRAMFDIGVSGPVAGFFACLIVLAYGFSNLPGPEYILAIHPDYFNNTQAAAGEYLVFGDTIIFSLMREIFTSSDQFVPPMSEIYHYPYLCVGWFGLFVTAMNMIPVGQLDGGHVIYSMFGERVHRLIAQTSVIILILLGFGGIFIEFLNIDVGVGWTGWLLWAILLTTVIKINHPPVYFFEELDLKRKVTGYFSLIILVISFSPMPFSLGL